MHDIFQSFLFAPSGLNSSEWLALSVLILGASIIRGYAGFGFSAIVVASASLFLPTREVVPLVLLLEVTASLQMARQVWKDVNWRLVSSILLGSLLFIPAGQYVLLWVAIEPMRVITATLLLIAVLLTASGKSLPVSNGPKGWILIGTVSGFMNGLLAMGGMWIMIFLLGSGIKVATVRASLVALFFATDSYAVLTATGQGLVNTSILTRFILVLPGLFLGIWIGARTFASSRATTYKKVVFTVLASLASLLLIKALFSNL